jgi:hypothetical protein
MRSLVLAAALCCSLPAFAQSAGHVDGPANPAQGVQQSNPGNQPGQNPQLNQGVQPNQVTQQGAQSQQQAPNGQSPQPNQGVQRPNGQSPNASATGYPPTTSGQAPNGVTTGPHGVMMIMCSSAPAVTQAPDAVSQQARSGIQSQDANLKQWAVHCPTGQ